MRPRLPRRDRAGARLVLTPRERIKMRGYCTGPADGAPGGLGAVGLDYKAACCTCGKRVSITVRGLYAHHRPGTTTGPRPVP